MTTYIGNQPAGAKDYVTDTPIGSIMAWHSLTLPLGWIECNGQSTNGYPDLAAIIGANVPDLRGEFVRGLDNGRGVDSGRVLGSSQDDQFQNHDHYGKVEANASAFGTGWLAVGNGASTSSTYADLILGVNEGGLSSFPDARVGDETRPRNVALIYIIRAFDVIKEADGLIHYIGHNFIINGDFSINQRQYDGSAIATANYLYDRWKSNFSGGGTKTFAIDADGYVTVPALTNMHTGVEFNERLAGKTMTISWEGTAKVWVEAADGYTYDLHESPYTFVSQGSAGAAGELDFFGFNGGTVRNVKLELGSTPTPFEHPEASEELVRCMRYYQRYTPYAFGGIGCKRATGGGANLEGVSQLHLQVPLRIDGSRGATFKCVESTTGAVYAGVSLTRTGAAGVVLSGQSIDGWIGYDTTTGNREGTVAVLSVYPSTVVSNSHVHFAEYGGGAPEIQLFADF